METIDTSHAKPGLRERKKQQTRDTIARVALQLFAEQGYDQTTLAEIAEAADVSPRTIFAYFQSKEDIVFCDEPLFHQQLKQKLDQRPPGSTTVDALRDFISNAEPPDQLAGLRKKIISSNEALRLSDHARSGPLEELIAESIAKDLDAAPGDIRPPLIAASIRAAFTTARERLEAQSGEPITHEQAMGILDEVLEFLRGGLQALQRS
ncbi:MAG TPA: TetR family transcriptional regulator [Solirubrobacteraceae bacterium]|jgi:AcrR family transcriptional regulator